MDKAAFWFGLSVGAILQTVVLFFSSMVFQERKQMLKDRHLAEEDD